MTYVSDQQYGKIILRIKDSEKELIEKDRQNII